MTPLPHLTPTPAGGIDGRTEATGLGLYYATRDFLNHPEFTAKHKFTPGTAGKTVVVQGFGNVGCAWGGRKCEGVQLEGAAEARACGSRDAAGWCC